MYVYILILCLLGAYLCGSIPFGYLFAKRAKGKEFDIRDWGSSNIGFTNVWKVLGLKIGLPVLFADVLKGLIPVLVCKYLFGEVWGAVALLLAALGHARSVYFFWREGVFSGGKAVATFLGGILALQPAIALFALVVWGIVLKKSEYMSVASISAGLAAFLGSVALTLIYNRGPFWNVILGLVCLAIICTHWRNIGRLIKGIESKITENRGAGDLDPKKKIVAFALHPLDMDDVGQMAPWLIRFLRKKVFTERDVRRIIRYFPVLESDLITGVKTLDGCEVTVLFIAIPLLPKQIKDPAYSKVLEAMLRAAAVQAQRRGAVILTLGALLSTEGNGGADLQKWATKRGLTITIDNGAPLTIAATIKMIETVVHRPLKECVVATVGASGIIGGTLVRQLARQEIAKSLIAIARSEKKIEGLKTLLFTSTALEGLREADVVIFTTSSPDYIITKENCHFLKKGAVIIDVAVPRDVDDKVLELRPDLLIYRSGLVVLPGEPSLAIDLHFGTVVRNGREVKLVPACLAGGVAMAAAGKYEHACTGAMIRWETISFFLDAIEMQGFEIVISKVSEPELFGRVVVK